MKPNWKEQTTLNKILSIARMIGSVATVALAVMQLLGVWNGAINLFIPLMGIVMLLQAAQEWKQNPGVAKFSLGTGLFIMACAVAVWLL